MILCSENCFHEDDGLCTLKEVTHPSSTPIKDCLYFKDKQRLILDEISTPTEHEADLSRGYTFTNSKIEQTPSSIEEAPGKLL